jgi:hypothetical protein
MAASLSGGVSRFLAVVLAAAMLAPLLAGGGSLAFAQDAAAEADATIRVIHGSPGAPDVDVLLDGQPLLEGIAYGEATDYVTITPEEHRLQVVPAGQTADAAVVDETIDAAPGAAYILAVFGLLNEIGGAVYDVDLSEIEPGNARVRALNLSPDAGAADLLETGGDEWFGGTGLGETSDYRIVAPGTYSLDLRGEDDRILRTVADLEFEETHAYDVVAVGQIADDSLTLLSLATRVSPPCAEVLGLEGEGQDACILFVHAAPDAPPIDIYLNDALVAEGLSYGTATEYVAVGSGDDRSVRVAAEGTPLEEAILDAGFGFEPGQAYEILVTGATDDLQLTITGADLRPLPEGQTRIRLIHASPDAGVVDLGVAGDESDLFAGVDFRAATDYLVLDAGEYPIEVRPGGDDMTVALQTELALEAGMVYDLVVLGRPDDQSLRILALAVPAEIRTGLVTTPEAEEGEAPLAGTAPPADEDAAAAGTPTS